MTDEKVINRAPVTGTPTTQHSVEPKKTNVYALLSFIFGLSQIFLSGIVIPTVLSIVFGHIALKQIKQNNEDGKTFALIGLISGYVALAFMVFILIMVVLIAFVGLILSLTAV